MAGEFLSKEEMRGVVVNSLREFAKWDMALLHVGVQEETLSHRVAVYLEQRLTGWHVDCEYNRDLKFPKMNPEGSHTMKPDIVAHIRNSPRNLLVIEVKKTNHKQQDIEKAKTRVGEFTGKWTRHPRYCHGVVLVFPVQHHDPKRIHCTWFHRAGCELLSGGKPETIIEEVSLFVNPEI